MTEQVQQQEQPKEGAENQPGTETPAKSAAELAAEAASKDQPLADVDYAGIDESYFKDGKPDYAKIAEALKGVQSDVPGEGADYEIAFPKEFDLKGEDGEVVKLDPADPIVAAFKNVAKENGLGQKAVNDLIGVYGEIIKSVVGQNEAEVKARQDAEFAKLDPDRTKAEERAVKVSRGLAAVLKDKAPALIETMTTAAAVEAFEALLSKINGDGLVAPNDTAKVQKKSPLEILYPALNGG